MSERSYHELFRVRVRFRDRVRVKDRDRTGIVFRVRVRFFLIIPWSGEGGNLSSVKLRVANKTTN